MRQKYTLQAANVRAQRVRCRSLNPTQKFASRIFEVLLLDLFHNVRFNDIADLDVVVLFEAQAALVALRDFLDGVLEALERGEVTLVDDDAVAHDTHVARALDLAVGDIAACDGADGRDLVGLANFGVADDGLAELRREHTLHSGLDLVDGVVNDAVHAHVDMVAGRAVARRGVRTDVEADDDGVRGRSR